MVRDMADRITLIMTVWSYSGYLHLTVLTFQSYSIHKKGLTIHNFRENEFITLPLGTYRKMLKENVGV